MTHAEVVAMLAAVYSTPSWEKETMKSYAKLLADIPASLLQAVAEDWVRSKTERPTIADLRRAAVEAQASASSLGLPAPDEAWGSVLREITRIGSYGEPAGLHPLVKQCVERMGWRQLCASVNQVADRAHFLQLYRGSYEKTLSASSASAGAMPQLPSENAPDLVAPARQIEHSSEKTRKLLSEVTSRLTKRSALALSPPERDGEPDPDPTPEQVAAREKRKAELRRQAEQLRDS